MKIKFIKTLDPISGYDYKEGDTVEDAVAVFGPAQAKYFLETGHAEAVEAKTETATAQK